MACAAGGKGRLEGVPLYWSWLGGEEGREGRGTPVLVLTGAGIVTLSWSWGKGGYPCPGTWLGCPLPTARTRTGGTLSPRKRTWDQMLGYLLTSPGEAGERTWDQRPGYFPVTDKKTRLWKYYLPVVLRTRAVKSRVLQSVRKATALTESSLR